MVSTLVSMYFIGPQLVHIVTNSIKVQTADPDMLNFNFWEKSLDLVSPPQFVYDFSRKIFLMLCFVNWPNFIVCLPAFKGFSVTKHCLRPEGGPLSESLTIKAWYKQNLFLILHHLLWFYFKFCSNVFILDLGLGFYRKLEALHLHRRL